MSIRETRATIDLDALAHNFDRVAEAAGPIHVFAVVKADGYGHGAVRCARRLVESGAYGFAVALVEEGLELREAGIEAPILVLNGAYGDAHAEVAAARLSPVVYSLEAIERFGALGVAVGLHLKVDTGMHRLGADPAEVPALLSALEAHPNLELEGLMSHLACAGEDRASVVRQLARFDVACEQARARGHTPMRHVANSAAAFAHPEARYDAVRAGIALYGGRAAPGLALPLEPVMRLTTTVLRVVDVPDGEAVGYGRQWVAEGARRVATLAIGYGDGLSRRLGGRGQLEIRGARCPIVGRVSMDLIAADVSHLPECEVGDEAVIFGGLVSVDEMADAIDTIAYEVLSNISARIPRTTSERA